jgi:hypothetical protein
VRLGEGNGSERRCPLSYELDLIVSSSTPVIATNQNMSTLNAMIELSSSGSNPVRSQRSGGFGSSELNRILKLAEDNREDLVRSWNEYFTR